MVESERLARLLKDAAKPRGIDVRLGPVLDDQARAGWMRSIQLNLMAAHERRTGKVLGLQQADDAIAGAQAAGGWDAVADLWVDLAKVTRRT